MGLGSVLFIVLYVVVGGVVVFAVQMVHLTAVVQWSERRTRGVGYCGASPGERRRFKRLLALHATLLTPILTLLARLSPFQFERATFRYRGVPGPSAGACSPESFAAAAEYEPRAEDVFVVTQMRSGTTWMQHLVFQLLTRGERDLADEGTTLNAVSPWLESNKTVAVDAAPLLGPGGGRRVIKTHLPASLCPYNERAKYVYVARRPESCFASCVDFVRNNSRGFRVSLEQCVGWFTSSDLMWWSTWVDHVVGWRSVADTADNVLLVRFEEMKADLPAVAERVARFLELPELDAESLARCVEKSGFDYMKRHEEVFEMHPPHLLQAPGRFLLKGANRPTDIPEATRQALTAWRSSELAKRGASLDGLFEGWGTAARRGSSCTEAGRSLARAQCRWAE